MYIALLLLLAAAPVMAQVNIEHYRGKSGVTGGARVSLSTDIGNVDVVNSNGAGNLTFNTETGTYLAVFKGDVGFLGGKRFANSGVLHTRYTYKRNPRWQPEFFVQGDYAKSRLLDSRFLAGAGMRWIARVGETFSASLGSALMWEREQLDLLQGDEHEELSSLARASHYVNIHLSGRITFSTTAYYQFVVSDPGDVRIVGISELMTPLVGPLHQTTSLDFRTDSDPPQGVKKTDLKLATSFGLKF
ncbi:MAG: hypothetical protein ACI906_002718 [Candidatus Latescibacterota bacterium]|jgi:hypothetical protein